MNKRPLMGPVIVASALLALAFNPSLAADKKSKPLMMGASAEALAYTCAGCHGTDGASNGPSIPTIGGLSPDYFVTIMEAYKSGEAKATIMDRIAKGYTEDEIKQMADFYAAKPFVRAAQAGGANAAQGAELHEDSCERCHSEGGTLAEDDAGILAGQWREYLSWQIHDALNGQRDVGKKMLKKLKKLHKKEGDAGFEALLDYYSSQK